MLYFKILPTDPRYQSLNLAQKFILSSAVNTEFKEKMDLVLASIDGIKNTFSSSLGFAELTGGEDHIKINSEFEKQSAIGRMTGKMKSSPPMLEALNEFYSSMKRNENNNEDENVIG